VLTLLDATFRYPGASVPSLRGVTLELPDGSITGLLGPGESGKSTLCLVLAGLAPRVTGGTLEGRLLIDGEDVTDQPMAALAGRVGCLLQDPSGQLTLMADTVLEEVAFGPATQGLPLPEVLARVEEALERVGIRHLAPRDPRHLSSGEAQLLAIASVLATGPRVLVLDEPTAHLDGVGTARVWGTLARLAGEGMAVLVADARTDALTGGCSRLALVSRGRIVASGPLTDVLDVARLRELGMDEPFDRRLRRLAHEAGLDAALVDRALPRGQGISRGADAKGT
jgi:energy-coupling factor transporter ATP-binding protein EcfA2